MNGWIVPPFLLAGRDTVGIAGWVDQICASPQKHARVDSHGGVLYVEA
jgi:hypothetical protein